MDGGADVEYVLGLKMLPGGLPELKSLEVQIDVLLVVQVEDSLSFAGRHIALSKRSYRFMQNQSDFGGAAVNNTGLSRKKWRPTFALPHAPITARPAYSHAPIAAKLTVPHAPVVAHAGLHGLLQFSIFSPSIF
jgi:hypothetical protein